MTECPKTLLIRENVNQNDTEVSSHILKTGQKIDEKMIIVNIREVMEW